MKSSGHDKWLKSSRVRRLEASDAAWYDLWHTHADWGGEGNKSPGRRRHFLRQLRGQYMAVLANLRGWDKPHQVWVIVDPADSMGDAVYVHSPNPNGTGFPYAFEGVDWHAPIPDWLSRIFSPELHRLGRSSDAGAELYWVRRRDDGDPSIDGTAHAASKP